jgi:hypothetical protein
MTGNHASRSAFGKDDSVYLFQYRLMKVSIFFGVRGRHFGRYVTHAPRPIIKLQRAGKETESAAPRRSVLVPPDANCILPCEDNTKDFADVRYCSRIAM